MKEPRCLCTTCNHEDVCAFKEEYTKVLDALKVINLGGSFDSFKCLVDFDWIETFELKCKYYEVHPRTYMGTADKTSSVNLY